MKRISFFLSCLFVTACTVFAQSKVAVYVAGDQEESVKKVLGSKMTSYITQSNDFTAVERTRDFLSALTAEHDYQVSGEVSNSQIVKLGQQFGARYVAVVDITELYGELFVSSRLIDVQTSQVVSSYEASGKDGSLSALTSLANDVADGLILLPERRKKQQRDAKEKERLAQLRQQAINNLMPRDGIICGNYIVINHKLPVKVIYNPNYSSVTEAFSLQIEGMPRGFECAGDVMLEYFMENYAKESSDPLYSFQKLNPDYMRFDRVFCDRRNRNRKDEIIYYNTSYFHLYFNKYKNEYFDYNVGIGRLTKTKEGWVVWINQAVNFGALVYREMFTEEEIQAEMNRISGGR